MFRKLYNLAEIKGSLCPNGPVLIAKGGLPPDPASPDMSFVRSVRFGEDTVYLPGSSVKGVLRAHAERLLATEIGPEAAEDPFKTDAPQRSKAHEEREKGKTALAYSVSCAADKLFGSTEIAGRFRVGDAYPPSPEAARLANRTEVRYGVAIDRTKQSVAFGPYEQEAVTQGEFALSAGLENFELWMLALVLQTLRDLHAGFLQIGHAKSRGFGSMTIEDLSVTLRWPGALPDQIKGAGACESDRETLRAYGLYEEDVAPLPSPCTPADEGLLNGYTFAGWEQVTGLLGALAKASWQDFVRRSKGTIKGTDRGK